MGASKPFRENWQTPIPFLRGIVEWMNGIAHVLNNIGMSSVAPSKVLASKDGIKFVLPLGGADGITDMGGSWGFKIIAYKRGDEEEHNPFLPQPDDDESDSASGTRALPPPFANLIRDGDGQQGGEDEEEEEDPVFWVKVLGGPAQVLGGREYLYEDQVFEDPLEDGTVLYLRYRITDEEGVAVCAWDHEVLTYNPNDEDEDNPFADPEDDEEESLAHDILFVIGKVGKEYENWVRQDRVGSIQSAAVINSSGAFINPTHEEL